MLAAYDRTVGAMCWLLSWLHFSHIASFSLNLLAWQTAQCGSLLQIGFSLLLSVGIYLMVTSYNGDKHLWWGGFAAL